MSKVFFYCLNTLISVCIDCVSFSINDGTELYNKLFEAKEIKLLCFSLIEKFYTDIPYQILNFIF